MKTTVVHHSADFDGLFSREVAKRFLGTTDVTYIGWDYGDPKLKFPEEGEVYVIDLNPECFEAFPGIDVAKARVIWIDHHKSAIDKWGTYLPGYRIDGVAACRLAWQWFSAFNRYEGQLAGRSPDLDWFHKNYPLPEKSDFIERKVLEPFALTLAGEYDVWDHRGDGDLELQFGLRTFDDNSEILEALLTKAEPILLDEMIDRGRIAMAYSKHVDASTMRSAFRVQFQGLKFLALNTARCNSQTFAALDKPETGHDALMAFYWNGEAWTFSLYHAAHRPDIDLSVIAKKYGGGGHKGACGFRQERIPFPLFPSRAYTSN
jgi:uncharacterized protein